MSAHSRSPLWRDRLTSPSVSSRSPLFIVDVAGLVIDPSASYRRLQLAGPYDVFQEVMERGASSHKVIRDACDAKFVESGSWLWL